MKSVKLSSAFESFLLTDVAHGAASDDTLQRYRCHARQWLHWCRRRRIAPESATARDVKLYRRALLQAGYKSSSIALKLCSVRQLYRAAQEACLRPDNPAEGLKPPREHESPEPSHFSEQELAGLFEVLPKDDSVRSLRDRALVGLMSLHGLRTVQVHRASVEDLELGPEPRLLTRGKGRRHWLALRPDLAELLESYLRGRPRVPADEQGTPLLTSLSAPGRRLSRRGLRHVVDGYLREAGLKTPGSSTHALRHTAGTLAYRHSRDLRAVQEMLGHASPRTTARYAHLVDRAQSPALAVPVGL